MSRGLGFRALNPKPCLGMFRDLGFRLNLFSAYQASGGFTGWPIRPYRSLKLPFLES